MKVAAKVYKGIEFVGVEDLSARQQLALKDNKSLERIKILIDGKIVSNCIQYQHYATWYAANFGKENISSTAQPVVSSQNSVTVSSY